MPLILMNWRVWTAAALAVLLLGTHFKAYQAGSASTQALWDAQTAENTKKTLELVEAAREKERLLQTKVDKVATKYEKAKRVNSDLSLKLTDSLRDFQATLDQRDAESSQSSTVDHGATTERIVLGYCAKSLQNMATVADQHKEQIIALQDYINQLKGEK